MKEHRNFTLVELLVVVGIIAVLAGLLTPAVINAQQQGRITQAKSDMAAILLALKGLESTYGKMIAKDGSDYKMGNERWDIKRDGTDDKSVILDGPENKDAYYAFIAELSDPTNGKANFTDNLSLNKRKIRFLDPKPEYDPSEDYDSDGSGTSPDNTQHLWLDPWGNPYVILINVDYTDEIMDPSRSGNAKVAAKAIVFSYGPDGEGDVSDPDDDTNSDNVCSWKDSWK